MLKRVGESRHPCRTPTVVRNQSPIIIINNLLTARVVGAPQMILQPVFYAAVEEDGTSGLVIEVFDDLDKVCADVVLLHGCPQSCIRSSHNYRFDDFAPVMHCLCVSMLLAISQCRPSY